MNPARFPHDVKGVDASPLQGPFGGDVLRCGLVTLIVIEIARKIIWPRGGTYRGCAWRGRVYKSADASGKKTVPLRHGRACPGHLRGSTRAVLGRIALNARSRRARTLGRGIPFPRRLER